jgi:predicted HTH transcriptional regulator
LAVLLFAEFPSDLLGEKCAIRVFHYQGERIVHTGNTTNLVRPPRTVGGPLLHQIREGLFSDRIEVESPGGLPYRLSQNN